MKIWGVVLSLLLVFMVSAIPLSLLAAASNGGFESGDFSGWTLNTAPNGGSGWVAQQVIAYDSNSHPVSIFSAKEGMYFAAMYPGDNGFYTTLTQAFTIGAGDTISGWALFISADEMPYNDRGQMVIKNAAGAEIAIPFDASVESVGNTIGANTGWTNWTYLFPSDGNYTLEARVTNGEAPGYSSILAIDGVTVTGTALPSASAGGPYSLNEGDSVTVHGSGADPDNMPITFSWDMDNDGVFETPGKNTLFSAANIAGPASRTIAVKVTSSSGTFATASTTVTIDNVVPTVNAGMDATVASGAYFHGTGKFFHPDTTVCTVTTDWGDGAPIVTLFTGTPSGGSVSFDMNHQFVLPQGISSQVFTITVRANDNHGGVGFDTALVNVVTPAGPPEIEPISAPSVVNAGQTINFDVIAEDPNQYAVTITAAGLPPGAVFSETGGIEGTSRYKSTFTWTPACSDARTTPYRIDFTARSVTTLTATTNVNITVNSAPPVANAGGPYNVYFGNGVTLNANASSTVGSACGVSLVKYDWDLNGDGQYNDRTGALVTLSAADLVALGFTNYGYSYPIAVRVMDSAGLSAMANTTLTITAVTITATAGAGGTISPAGVVVTNYNASQTFAIAPIVGYHITGISVDGVSQGVLTSYTFNNVVANHTISASFDINTYTITANAGANGTVSPAGTVTVNHGINQLFTFIPDTGYHVAEVIADGISVGTPATYSFNNVTGNHIISVSFAINTYTITATAGSNGSIAPPGVTTVNYGGSLTYNIIPNQGYYVLDVLVDNVSVGAVTTRTFSNVTSNHTITASFAPNKVVYLINASAGTNGTIMPSGIVNVYQGESTTFAIAPNAGYHTVNVTVDNVPQGVLTSYTFNNVTANHSITASFAINTYTITANAGANGGITPNGAVVVNHGVTQTFTITPNLGYKVTDVLIDGISAGALSTYTFTNVTANHTITASFMQVSYTLTVTIEGSGTVTKTPSLASYPAGTVVSLKAEPAANWKFDHWEGALSGSVNPATVTMDGNKTVKAVFTRQVIVLDSFLIKHLHINWDKDNKNKKKQGEAEILSSANFHVYGRMKLPAGMSYVDFQEAAIVTLTISNGIVSDNVAFKKAGTVWQYKGKGKLSGAGLDVEKMSLWWAPDTSNWAGMAGFHIKGEFEMPTGVTGTVLPPQVTVSVKLVTKAGMDVFGGTTVLCDVSGQGSVWQYNAHTGWPQFPFDIANEDD